MKMAPAAKDKSAAGSVYVYIARVLHAYRQLMILSMIA